ncbi:MAG: alpha/beta hydrolase family protein [Planctomycetota bacterium]
MRTAHETWRPTPAPSYLRPSFAAWGFSAKERADLATPTLRVIAFTLESYCDAAGRYHTIHGELYLPTGAGLFPLIAVSPILGGAWTDYLDCRMFGAAAVRSGYGAYFLHQDAVLLKPRTGAVELERSLRCWVTDMIVTLDELVAHYPIDARQLGTFGLSLGAIRNVLLAAAEPRFRAHVFGIGGGGMWRLLRDSGEKNVRRYIARRSECLQRPEQEVLAELRRGVLSEPLLLARTIDPRHVLMFLAQQDHTVPYACGLHLYDALGQPELRLSPLGHYTSILLLPWVSRWAMDFYRRRFTATEESCGVDDSE